MKKSKVNHSPADHGTMTKGQWADVIANERAILNAKVPPMRSVFWHPVEAGLPSPYVTVLVFIPKLDAVSVGHRGLGPEERTEWIIPGHPGHTVSHWALIQKPVKK